jgi:predicted acyltransferase (DUF342 family)
MSSKYISQVTPQKNINIACNSIVTTEDIVANNDIIVNNDCVIQNNLRCYQDSVFDRNLNVGSLTIGNSGANIDMGDDNNIKTSSTSTGTMIGLSASEKLGFHGVPPGTMHSSNGEM